MEQLGQGQSVEQQDHRQPERQESSREGRLAIGDEGPATAHRAMPPSTAKVTFRRFHRASAHARRMASRARSTSSTGARSSRVFHSGSVLPTGATRPLFTCPAPGRGHASRRARMSRGGQRAKQAVR
ncbi:hypothetical protein D7V80_03945 [Corallococcus sp. CA054B]|nr:hypothetical protein D7V80_03945 [Corallococcus sp. CA054B]